MVRSENSNVPNVPQTERKVILDENYDWIEDEATMEELEDQLQ